MLVRGVSTERLESLSEHGRTAGRDQASWDPVDSVAHLSQERRSGWRRILASVATTEAIEGTLIAPIEEAFSGDPAALAYLEAHSSDEDRHHRILSRYLWNTYQYRKEHRTASDAVIYDALLPRLARSFGAKPLRGLAMLHCYEAFSLLFYRVFKERASEDGLPGILSCVRAIEKDELRHVSGVETLCRLAVERDGPPGPGERLAIRALLGIMGLDVNMSRWALHNREVRAHFAMLGIAPDSINRAAREARERTLAFLDGLGGTP